MLYELIQAAQTAAEQAPVVPPQPNVWTQLSAWIAGSTAAGVSFALNVVSFVFAVIGFVLYFRQKAEYRLLFAIFEEYGLREQISTDTSRTKKKHDEARATLANTQEQIEEAKRDLEERLPAQARRAYLQNTIPIIEEQISDLGHRLRIMREDLAKNSADVAPTSPQIDRILKHELRKHVEIRRDLETAQSNLTVLTGLAAAIGALPYFIGSFALTPVFALLGLLIFLQSLRIFQASSRLLSCPRR